jgi:hypothetical protein
MGGVPCASGLGRDVGPRPPILPDVCLTRSGVLGVTVGLALVAALAQAGGRALPDTALVAANVPPDATASNNQTKIVRVPAGLVVAYVGRDGAATQVFLALSRDDGVHWSLLGRASQGQVSSRLPAVARTATGELHVVWTRYDGGVGTVYDRVWAGGRWTGPPRRLSAGGGYAGYPAVAATAGGALQVAWYGIVQGTPPAATRHGALYEIYATGFDGRGWSRPQRISPGLPDAVNPALAADAGGRVHAAWFQFDGHSYQVRYARWEGVWDRPGPVYRVGVDEFNPDLATDAAGHVTVVWEHHAASGSRIAAATWRGARWDGPVLLSAPPPEAFHPSVAAGGSGTVAVAWEGEDGQVYLRRYAQAWGPVVRLTGEGVNAFPSVLVEGPWIDLVWTHSSPRGSEVRFLRVPARP